MSAKKNKTERPDSLRAIWKRNGEQVKKEREESRANPGRVRKVLRRIGRVAMTAITGGVIFMTFVFFLCPTVTGYVFGYTNITVMDDFSLYLMANLFPAFMAVCFLTAFGIFLEVWQYRFWKKQFGELIDKKEA